ncbi:allantoinase [Microbacterium endophyticum]|uniref:allantoinase n=1 Tax=Microbacterium endophyticum TaxID=1526412 RepID=A0A7W4V6I3_9MICO|nr:allantoinase AllB [Microbacterium endophyticum]MBB2977118.1 allantoinase [Microbacterium endophyticum]NIK36046.1 allantoinase [Microbacterium endophyticum]
MSIASPASIAAHRAFIAGEFRPATVDMTDGLVTTIRDFDDTADVVVGDDVVLLPGLVDSHVHLDEPGRTEWEGFATGTAAAVAGGVTTVLDMPLNSVPVTTTPEALAAKRAAAQGKLAVDVGYWGGAVPENLGTLAQLAEAGVVGFKCFLSPSGIDEFGHLDTAQLETALAEIVKFDGVLIVHAEDPAHLHADGALGPHYIDFLASRPGISERSAIGQVIDAAHRTGARAHIVHVSDGAALDEVRAAKARGVRLTVETCPHYLTLKAEDVPDGAGAFKACPPIRDAKNQDLLWQGVVDGTIDAIVSDHSPATLALKEQGDGDFGLAWGGIAGLQTGLSAVWTAAKSRGIPLETILPLMTTGPARIGGLGSRGRIAIGEPAHLTVFHPDASYTVRAEALEYRNPMSPWDGATLDGVVESTLVHGQIAYRRGEQVSVRAGREILAKTLREVPE